ncbi:hypothetical protein F5148DRAFT_1146414 [Russula earlei]|uniref:Uncharacterized protein n=1 Tax=Russula earlei TaxID=71964 RepID=A0ACC0ULE4_9AGAM|nr:hypothetical protein F5148DRAFT_1146414 [Russula earlei]
MQSLSSLNTSGPTSGQPPLAPFRQSSTSPIHVQPPSPTQGAPPFPFPVPEPSPTVTQLMAADGGDAHNSVAPPFPVPYRHETIAAPPSSPSYLRPLRAVQSDSALSSHSSSSLSQNSPQMNEPGTPEVIYVSETSQSKKLLETLVYPEGEIPILEVDGSGMNIHFKPLTTKVYNRRPWWKMFGSNKSWINAYGALSDNHFLLLKEETSMDGSITSGHLIKPIPLGCLRLASFDSDPEIRKMSQDSGRRGSRSSSSSSVMLFPFTIYHAAAKITRRHTVYTHSATERNRWQTILDNAIEARRSQEAPIMLTRAFYTGPTICAALFSFQGEGYIAVGCTSGIYVSKRTTDYAFRRVLEFNGPQSIVAIPVFNKFIVHCESALFSYPLDMVVRVSQGDCASNTLDDSVEWLAGEHVPISLLKVGSGGNRTPVTIGEDPHDATFYLDKIVICASKAVYIADLINTPDSSPTTVPDFPNSKRDDKTLKFVYKGKGVAPKIFGLAGDSNILGTVTCETANDILLVYDSFGCFMAKDGKPARSIYYIEWERRAVAHARRGAHLLLFSPGYIEVRNIETGKLVHMKETNDMRLLRSGLMGTGVLIAAMPGGTDDDGGRTERLVKLVYVGDGARVDGTHEVTLG